MDLLDAEEGFSFIWTIQNYNMCFRKSKDVFYESPTFELDDDSNEKWSFTLFPKRKFRHDDIGLKLHRSTTGKYRTLRVKISISDVKGSFKISKNTNRITFQTNHTTWTNFFNLTLNKVLENYPKNDSLIINCKIFQMETGVIKARQCFARTVIGTERILHSCTLEGFEEIENGTKLEKSIIILSEIPLFKMVFSSTGEMYAESKIEVKVKPIKPNNEFYSTCEISLIDVDGQIAHSVRDECNFEIETSSSEQIRTFSFIQASKLLRNKRLYFQNGVLHLICEFVVSSGVTYNRVERTELGVNRHPLLMCNYNTSDSLFTESLKDDMQRFYKEEHFSDVTIRAPTKEFRVHKTILCVRSKVFRAMFQRDTKESQTGIVEIEDVDGDTVSKMLLFMYTDTVGEDLEFETASSLYSAADKYGIGALKRKCADFIGANFTVTNICGVLVLADMHQDEELKHAARKFIFGHSEEIVYSAEWKHLMQNHPQLASETMYLFMLKSKSLNI